MAGAGHAPAQVLPLQPLVEPLGRHRRVLGEQIPREGGVMLDPVHDPEIMRRLQRDRRRWKACDGFQAILSGEL